MAKHVKHDPPDLDDVLEHVVCEMWKYKQSVAYYAPIRQAGSDLDQLIFDFLDGLSIHHKQICRHWVTTWLTGPYPCNDSLRDLVAILQ